MSDFLSARRVCLHWSTSSDLLWEDLYKRTWKVTHNSGASWKYLFLERAQLLCIANRLKISSKIKTLISKRKVGNLINKGFMHIYRREWENALDCFEKAVTIEKSARAYEGLTRIYHYRKVPFIVIVYAEACLRMKPVNPGEIFFLRGKALHAQKRLIETLQDYTQAIEYLTVSPVKYHIDLRPAEVYFERMKIYLELGKYDEAYKDCEAITKLKYTEGEECWFVCGRELFQQKQYQQAVRFLEKAQNKNKTYYLLFMRVWCSVGDYQKALKCLQEFQNSPDKDVNIQDALLDIGIIWMMNSKPQQAIESFVQHQIEKEKRHSFDIKCTTPPEKMEQAKTLTMNACIRQISSHNPKFITMEISWSYYYLLLGMIGVCKNASKTNECKDEIKMAITNFTRCITLNPTLSESYYYRALLQCYQLLLDDPCSYVGGKQKTCVQTMSVYDNIETKLVKSNVLREALLDLNNADSLSKNHKNIDYVVSIKTLMIYVLHCMERSKDAIEQCNIAIELDSKGSKSSLVKLYALRSVIMQNEEDMTYAYNLDKQHKLLSIPSRDCKLDEIIYSAIFSNKFS